MKILKKYTLYAWLDGVRYFMLTTDDKASLKYYKKFFKHFYNVERFEEE